MRAYLFASQRTIEPRLASVCVAISANTALHRNPHTAEQRVATWYAPPNANSQRPLFHPLALGGASEVAGRSSQLQLYRRFPLFVGGASEVVSRSALLRGLISSGVPQLYRSFFFVWGRE